MNMLNMTFNRCLLVTIMLVITMPVHSEEFESAELGTLFTNEKQRAQIDAIRSGKSVKRGKKTATKVKLSGYMTRSDGKSVVWVNNNNTIESNRLNGLKVHKETVGKDDKVTVSIDGQRARLKPGETWHKESGKVVDNY